jgi:hypothetical protein
VFSGVMCSSLASSGMRKKHIERMASWKRGMVGRSVRAEARQMGGVGMSSPGTGAARADRVRREAVRRVWKSIVVGVVAERKV